MEPPEWLRPSTPPPLRGLIAERAQGWLVWVGWRRVVAAVLGAVAVALGAWWMFRADPPPVERALPYTSTSTPTATGPTSTPASLPARVVVHVAGAVVRSGLVTVAVDARIADAIEAAGGVVAGADPDALNLAARVVDGARIYVPRLGEVVPSAYIDSPGTTVVAPVDINGADASALDALPGIGPSLARAIVAYRDLHGPFRAVNDLLDVPGIGPSTLERFRTMVRT